MDLTYAQVKRLYKKKKYKYSVGAYQWIQPGIRSDFADGIHLNNFSRNEKSLNNSIKSILFACIFNVDDLEILGAGFKSSLDYNIFESLCSLYFFLYSDGDKSNCFLNAVLKCF